MKKIMTLCVVSVLLALGGGFVWGVFTYRNHVFPFNFLHMGSPSANDITNAPVYKVHKSRFDISHKQADIVMLGDSITDWGDDFITDEYPGLKVRNMGIAGDTTDGVLNRLDSVLATHPRKVFILLGINDIQQGAGVDGIFEKYKQIVDKLRSEKIDVYVQSTLYTTSGDFVEVSPKVSDLNGRLKQYCQVSGATFVDLCPVLCPGGQLDEELTDDGLHLTGKGFQLWAKALRPYLE